ncbi:MAG: MbcA/ParS/Xre antitoxin family protein [Bacteroidales bacterium]|nr:MbcA/ParS/Xre antitoxin family protein [Bacteroidales bacterium]
MKSYKIPDGQISYESIEENDALYLIQVARKGIVYPRFVALTKSFPFSINEWSGFLHLSERTMQRYQKEEKSFDPVVSEHILGVILLYKQATTVFGNKKKLDSWLNIPNVALGGVKPKELLDSYMGIQLIRNELIRIEHGIL